MLRKIAFNTILSFSARIIGVILGFFILGISTRLLGKEGFGLYSTALSWAYLFSFIADLGLYSFLAKEIAQATKGNEEHIAGNIVALRAMSLSLFLALGILIAWLLPWKLGVSMLAIVIASITYGFLSLSQVLMGIFQKYLRMEWPALAEVAGRMLVLGALIILIARYPAFLDYQGILLLALLGALAGFIINIISARFLIPLRFRADGSYWRQAVVTALPIGLAIIVTSVYFKLDTLFVAFFRSQEEVGLYTAAYRILENLIFFPAAFVGLLLPQFSKYALKDKQKFARLFQGAFDVLCVVTFPLVAGILFEAPAIMGLIAGQEFALAAKALGILSFAIAMIFFSSLFSQMFIVLNLQKLMLLVYGAAAALNVIANLFIIPRFGYIGASVTTLWTEAFVSFIMVQVIERRFSLRLRFGRLAPIILSTVLMGIFLASIQANTVVSVFGGALVYFLTLWISGGVSKRELLMIMEG